MADNDKPGVHDRLFKRTVGNPRHALGVFRSQLPADMVARADWSTLRMEPASFVDEELRERHCDLLYSVAVADRTILLYLLFEHQSGVDPLMPFRVLRYVVRIWDRWLDLEKNKGARALPAVVPLVLYHGAEPWSAATEVEEIIDLDPGLRASWRAYLPRLRFMLDDLARASEEEIRARRPMTAMARVAAAALKVLRGGEPIDFLKRWIPLVQQLSKEPGGLRDLDTLMYYVHGVCKYAQQEEVVGFMQENLDKEGRDVIVTSADAYRAEGREEGRVQEAAHAILAVFEARDMAVPDDVRRRIEASEDPEELAGWLRRAVVVGLPAEIFEG